MNMKIVLAFSILLAVAAATPYTDCGSVSTLTSVTIEGCDTVPCTFQRGVNVTVAVEWTSHAQVADFHAEILIDIGGSLIETPGLCDAKLPGQCSGCPSLTKGDCPLETAEVATYTKTILLDPTWPMIAQAEAIFKIDSEPEDQVLVCFIVPIVLQ